MSVLAIGNHGVLLAGGDNSLGAGFIGFMVVVALAVACYFLFRSMTRHLRKVPSTFETPPTDTDTQE